MSGATRYRSLWEQYYRNSAGVVFVVDSADRFRLVAAKDELHAMLGHAALARSPLLVLANKQDVKDAAIASEIAELLDLKEIRSRAWQICGTNALTGDGLDKGFDWLADAVPKTAAGGPPGGGRPA